jgi:hypothetical protein
MSKSVWYRKKQDLLYLLDKRDGEEYLTDREQERFENYLDKTTLITYHTHDDENLTPEYIKMCEIKMKRYEIEGWRTDEYYKSESKKTG